MLKTRLLTAAVALPAVVAAILFLPDSLFTLLIMALGLWALYETAEMTARASRPRVLGCLALGIVSGVYPFLFGPANYSWMVPAVAAILMLALVAEVGALGAEQALARCNAWFGEPGTMRLLAAIGAFYTGLVFPYFALLRNSRRGIELVILMLLLVVCTDSGAYFVGRAVGRHKLAPNVSPGKTVEGGIGGMVAAVAAGLILRRCLVPQWSMAAIAGFASIVAVLAIVGDLMNSAFKRLARVKDSGWIFPGHGGLLDRTCSLVLAAVLTYYYSG